ncbi:RNA-binding transcriptional accessory protein [Anaerotruncus sp. 80]|uniref:RNA-binding transcriptional accessory protein n=1 Tax=Anaerotruncus colihominis TaxID=169435 RepID=A0A845QIE9_9FIRM|nr:MULTISPECIES: Tex family protein [Anaerotruncus]NBH61326.1 RNA-binding transcriptional accessory protein [Anaerotruncus colihominis]NCF01981.1 RNA-binding transcriptional accessory protein [Anaerotruncus sp. 80]
MNIIEKLASEFKVKTAQVESTVALIDEGNTIPFIARYRKEVTGGLTDVTLRDMDERLQYLRNLESRKEEVLRLIEEQGKLTEELKVEIQKAEVLQRVEDLYKPYKQKKATRASKAKERGLEPLAMIFYAQQKKEGNPLDFAADFINPDKEVETAEDAVQGAMDIIAEMIADDADLTKAIREKTFAKGQIATEATDPEEKTVYEMYYGSSEAIAKMPNHRVLAVNRGEKEKKLKVKVAIDSEEITGLIAKQVIRGKSIFTGLLEETIADSYKRLIAPSIEREMRNILTERAETEAVKVFAKNTEKLLMVPPVKGKKIISIDPGYRTGCKVAVLDETGKLKAYTTIYPTEPKNDVAGTERTLEKIINKFGTDIIVIGNGTASRETEEVVANFLKKHDYDIQYTIVNEAGASVYSASKLATEEYPDLDVTTRGAMSLGRRLQDPLAELVKIDPKHIGVGQYQHDINQKQLDTALTNVVEDCVNRVGVDLNTASPSLLSYIAGVNMGIAKNIVAYREENGRFKNRKELMKVSKLGEKAFKQCAGFMRIADGSEPLDSTSVHPESYKAAEEMMNKIGITKEEILCGGAKNIDEKIWEAYPAKKPSESVKKMAEDLGIGEMTLSDIIAEMKKPARDPREDAPPVIFRNDVRSFEDLKVDMELTGTVRNVVDFGAFVDIGVKQDGLVHVSQLSNKFIKHPMDVVSVGDTVKVKILSVDPEKKKIALTMKF